MKCVLLWIRSPVLFKSPPTPFLALTPFLFCVHFLCLQADFSTTLMSIGTTFRYLYSICMVVLTLLNISVYFNNCFTVQRWIFRVSVLHWTHRLHYLKKEGLFYPIFFFFFSEWKKVKVAQNKEPKEKKIWSLGQRRNIYSIGYTIIRYTLVEILFPEECCWEYMQHKW